MNKVKIEAWRIGEEHLHDYHARRRAITTLLGETDAQTMRVVLTVANLAASAIRAHNKRWNHA